MRELVLTKPGIMQSLLRFYFLRNLGYIFRIHGIDVMRQARTVWMGSIMGRPQLGHHSFIDLYHNVWPIGIGRIVIKLKAITDTSMLDLAQGLQEFFFACNRPVINDEAVQPLHEVGKGRQDRNTPLTSKESDDCENSECKDDPCPREFFHDVRFEPTRNILQA